MTASVPPAQSARMVDALAARCNSGPIRFYNGPPPANAAAALSGNTVLAEATFGNPAFAAANPATGIATANAIAGDASNDNTGRPSFCRLFEAGGTVVVAQLLAAYPWAQNTAYAVGDHAVANGNQYRVTAVAGGGLSAGTGTGPAGTGASIADNQVTWAFVGQADVTFSGAQVVQGGQLNVSSLQLGPVPL